METIEYPNNPGIDKSGWPDGPWMSEPDKIQWPDEQTGLPCLIVRNRMGALCGYVGVPQGHRFYGVQYDGVRVDDDWAPAHGGLTYSAPCTDHEPGEEAQHICHVPGEGEPDDVWWLGFDCSHAWDYMPAMQRFHDEFDAKHGPREYERDDVYRNMPYVKGEVAALARWLAEHGGAA